MNTRDAAVMKHRLVDSAGREADKRLSGWTMARHRRLFDNDHGSLS